MKDTIHAMQEMEPSGEVHLLPSFDVYTVGLPRGKNLERLISAEHRKKVYRLQGWVSAVVLLDGEIKGIWDYEVTRKMTSITVNLFSSISKKAEERIAIEAERFGKFLNSPVSLEFSQD